jgi:hypothetical protein
LPHKNVRNSVKPIFPSGTSQEASLHGAIFDYAGWFGLWALVVFEAAGPGYDTGSSWGRINSPEENVRKKALSRQIYYIFV